MEEEFPLLAAQELVAVVEHHPQNPPVFVFQRCAPAEICFDEDTINGVHVHDVNMAPCMCVGNKMLESRL